MRVEVRTCSQVRVMLDLDTVKSQRRILNGDREHCQVILLTGKTLDLEKPVPGIELQPDIDIPDKKKSRFMDRLSSKIEADKEGRQDGKIV
jgi:hypothetical protein